MAGDFQFIPINTPNDAKDRAKRRLARSHAVKRALGNKRRQQQLSGDIFAKTTAGHHHSEKKSQERRVVSPLSLLTGIFDPFQALAVDSSRLQVLLGDYRARQAPEPVFSVAEELAFQSFSSVFRAGLDDPALVNAVMLSLAFAVTGRIDSECLRYQGQAITYIRERMDSLAEATSEATIGTILLLAGIVARLGLTSQVEMHMGAVRQLLKVCQARGVYLTPGIKRAIFWQDLNSSILSGSTRIVDHTTFTELLWARDAFVPSFYRLPSGFESRSHLFTQEFIDILEDLNGLHCIRESRNARKSDAMFMLHVNNHTASVQSRLAHLSGLSELQECCRLAAYLCSVMVCCKVWCELVIPSHISSELLRKLPNTDDNTLWAEHSQLLVWLLHIGGAFAPIGPVRSGYLSLLRSNDATLHCSLWPELHTGLKQFIWSDKAFLAPVRALWEEAFM
ncbi:hypothetical protein ASPCAL13274 [Aspergillus calidoustus]|uniref:Transcription factor domain-containing protein n=1 Tax=Aspergillus calidoustus TaxID=454130 RepID=A0A0U4ZKN5_ASPCI|nr:hypothetical protein ASPCAL13274 [Aspergillus calidoustus]